MRLLTALFLSTLQYTAIVSAESYPAPIKLGAILALTGSAAIYGESVRGGMQLASEELVAQGRPRVDLKFENDEGRSAITVMAFQKFALDSSISAVVSMSAQPSLAIAPLGDQTGIPIIGIAVPPKIVHGHPSVFLFFSIAEDLAESLVSEAARRNYHRVARISSIHEGRQTVKIFVDSTNAGRLIFPIDAEYPVADRDFRTFFARVRADPTIDAIYANLFLGQLGVFSKQARESGITLPIFTTEFFNDRNELNLAGSALDGQWFVDERQPTDWFIERFTKRFGYPPSLGAGNGYDIIMLLSKAVESGATTRESILEFLRTARDVGAALGTYSATGDNRFKIPVAVKVLQYNAASKEYSIISTPTTPSLSPHSTPAP